MTSMDPMRPKLAGRTVSISTGSPSTTVATWPPISESFASSDLM
jgi:hypothetical protein